MEMTVKPTNALNLLPSEKVPLRCPVLTRFLNGGIPVGSVTELAGESGSGKTQISLHLLLSSSPSPSLFIHSEFPFPIRRLQILSRICHGPNPRPDPLDSILVAGAHTPHDLLSLLSHAQSSLLPSSPSPFKLLVVDSIAALFRSDFESTAADLARRSRLFFAVSSKLKEIAWKFSLAVLVTNQVVDVVGPAGVRVGNYPELRTSGRSVWPALGLSWSSCINIRLFLSREEELEGGALRARRWIRVVFAPHLPKGSVEFVIRKDGVFGFGVKRWRPIRKILRAGGIVLHFSNP